VGISPWEKLAQELIHGAKVIELKGNFDDALTLVREIHRRCDNACHSLIRTGKGQ
jgi:threonine synthase